MANENILSLMVAHHALLETLFVVFKDEVGGNPSRAGASLSEFAWEMKKHFFCEENAIFDFLPSKNIEIWNNIKKLKAEHVIMLDSLKNFSDNLSKIENKEIEEFYNLLKSHREVEEKELYPELDKKLPIEQKKQIVSRINEIPLNFSKN